MQKQVLSATALALLIGVSTFTLNTALAQNGGEARSNDREMKKALDDKHLTPVRPIRRVGEDNWPAAKNQPAPVETTGQSARKDEKQEPAKQDAKETTSQETPKQDTAKQEPAKQEPPKQDTARQDAKPDAKPEAKPETKPEQKQETAKQDAARPESKPDTRPQDTAKAGDRDKNDKGFASIRLGTDKDGRVAVNDAQEKQIAKVMRKQHVDTVNVKVSVGSVAPANVRLVAVSSDMIDILPQFRGYNYFATSEEIVIVEPSTKKVVALIPAKLTATASRADDERSTRTETRRTESRTTSRTTKERDVTVGRSARIDDVPSREEILAAPVARGPAGTTVTRTYRTYQYEEPADVVIIERRRPRIFGLW